jgi:hypothetical protein
VVTTLQGGGGIGNYGTITNLNNINLLITGKYIITWSVGLYNPQTTTTTLNLVTISLGSSNTTINGDSNSDGWFQSDVATLLPNNTQVNTYNGTYIYNGAAPGFTLSGTGGNGTLYLNIKVKWSGYVNVSASNLSAIKVG